jgi:hypothetical protein
MGIETMFGIGKESTKQLGSQLPVPSWNLEQYLGGCFAASIAQGTTAQDKIRKQ